MPRNRNELTTTQSESTELAMPDDVRADLLRAQAGALEGSSMALPRVKIMPQGINLFEFEGDAETPRSFDGIVLSYHAQNVLWDKPFGTERDPNDPQAAMPACQSADAVVGHPREGFAHLNLAEPAEQGDAVSCKVCKYNAWESARLIGKQGKGKACTNQISVYVMLEGKAMPVQLTLPPTSITAWNEYLMATLNRQMPVQALLTRFALVKKERGDLKWSQATFAEVRTLTTEEFALAKERKATFADAMNPVRVIEAADDRPGF